MTDIRIANNSQVTLHFAIKLDNGDVVDSTFDKAPATFKVGDGNLLPGFEQALFGLKGGDQRSLPIAPEHGFGQPNPQNVQVMPRSQFKDMDLAEGNMLQVIVFSILFGVAIARTGGTIGANMAAFFENLNQVVLKMVMLLIDFVFRK